ncbi:hypothetical protein GALL_18030 [mine drainage metagenome]|uniref:Putative Flp pilus-assembly TadG-like N-terminal domain-containing protein n=1 Tax=mine drainage metagenome TaxID=410659 RepID=A0A1J5T9S2_9ZZZZ
MTTQRPCRTQSRQCQNGAVAIIVALALIAMIGILGIVLDLGHLYVAKTELQNAADAAALSGAKQLNGKLSGVCCGVDSAQARAIEAAAANNYDLNSTALVITAANLSVGSCPDDACMVPISSITTDALAADKTFLKVDTNNRNFNAWFSRVWNILQTQTFGLAVAGKYEVDITPIGICRQPDPGTIPNELGFERGVAYKVSNFNPIGPGTMYWLDPESNTPGSCSVTNTSGTLPYICTGKTGYTPVVGQTVNTNTGISDPQLEALDSRFDVFNTKNKCDATTAPPDRNIKEYIYSDGAAGSPSTWMHKPPNLAQQSITPVDSATNGTCKSGKPCKPIPYAPPTPTLRTFSDYGVLWSAFRPVGKTTSDWPTLYSGGTATSYPEPSPYAQTSGNFFLAPSHPSRSGRRVLNMVILECLSAGGVCRPAVVLGVGKFLMQKKANQSPDKDLYVEFGGLLPTPLPTSDIKLYR